LTRKAVAQALAGNGAALRLCLERILAPCRERAVRLALPPVRGAADIAPMMQAVAAAVAKAILLWTMTQRSIRRRGAAQDVVDHDGADFRFYGEDKCAMPRSGGETLPDTPREEARYRRSTARSSFR